MIKQDSYWRKELKGIAFKLEKRYRQQKWSAITEFNFEKEIFIGFFIVRKLMENDYVSLKIVSLNYEVMTYPHTPKIDAKHFLHNINLMKGEEVTISIKSLCNQFIHSFNLTPFIPRDSEMTGIYFCSDFFKSKKLFYIQLIKIIELFLAVSNDLFRPLNLNFINNKFYSNIEKI